MMNEHVDQLFQLTRRRISKRHIVDFSPADPGYDAYVRLWSEIHRTGEIPRESEFDLSEVIGLTGWADAVDYDSGKRFRDYRRFTSAVAVALVTGGNDSECVRVANYLARDLIIDIDINDREHFDAVRKVFPAVRDALIMSNNENEYPFFTLGSLILAHQAGDFKPMPSLAKQLIDDEAAVRNKEELKWSVVDSRFLFGLTVYDQLNREWVRLVSSITNPNNDNNIQWIIDRLADYAQ